MQLFFLMDPWNIPFADPVDLVLVKCSWILPCFFVFFGIILLKCDVILLEILGWQFGGSFELTITSKRRH